MQDTSLKAYREEVEGTLAERQAEVLEMLGIMGEATNSELAHALLWSINRVTGRIFELRKGGRVADMGKRVCKITGRMAHIWAVIPLQKKLV